MAKGRILHELSLSAIAAVDHPCQEHAKMTIIKRDYSADQRKEMAGKGQALPDGSFPIANKSDLHNAIQAIGRASDKAAAKAHIIARAKDLGAIDTLPEAWNVGISKEEDMTDAEKMAALQKSVDEMTSNLAKATADLAKANADHAATTAELAKAKTTMAAMEDAKDGGVDDAMEDKNGKCTKKGLAFIAKHAGADEILKIGDATISKRVVGEETFKFMKAQQDQIAKEQGLRVDAEMAKRADSEFPSLVGSAAEKGAILKHLSTAPAEVVKAAEAILKAAEEATKGAYITKGSRSGDVAPDLAKARQTFMAKVNEIKDARKISKTDAMSKAADEFPDLYKAYQGESSEVEAA